MAATVKREQGGQMPDVHDLSSLLDTLAENTDGAGATARFSFSWALSRSAR